MPTYTVVDDPDNPEPMQHPGITLVDHDGGPYNPATSIPDGTYAKAAEVRPGSATPLVIPTYDDDANVTHPSVVVFPTAWNGYRYWMAFTPYPAASRENPSIVASHNGIDWEEPPGITNPVVALGEATPGFSWNSDTHLVMLPDGVTMAMYWRPYKDTATFKEAVWRKTSTNGVTWSAATQVVLGDGATARKVVSPAVEVEADGSMTMWVVNAESAPTTPSTIMRRTSADNGLTWSAATTCTIPAKDSAHRSVMPWHIDVKIANGVYYMLVSALRGGEIVQGARLYLWTSADGITWTSPDGSLPCLPLINENSRYYRSAFWPVPGNPGTFDLWLANIDNTTGTEVWRFEYRRATLPPVAHPWTEDIIRARMAVRPFLAGDSFNRLDDATALGTADSGQAWTTRQGTMGISGGLAYGVGGANSYATIPNTVINVEVGAEVGGAALSEGYLVFRFAGVSDRWRFGLASTAGILQLQRIVGGAVTVLWNTGICAQLGDRLVVRTYPSGLIVLLRNDRIIFTTTDTTYANNSAQAQVGVQCSTADIRWDNFYLKNLT